MPRPAASALISIFQPLPTWSTPPMTLSIGMKTSRPQFGPFWNTCMAGRCRRPMLMPGKMRRHQCERDADIVALADQMIGIVQLECEAKHGRDRAERDVALVPVEPDAEHLLPVKRAAADDAGIDHRGGVGARFRAGQAEAGNFFAARQPRQPIILLRLGAELQQQFARAERVRHHRGARRPQIERVESLRMTSECA